MLTVGFLKMLQERQAFHQMYLFLLNKCTGKKIYYYMRAAGGTQGKKQTWVQFHKLCVYVLSVQYTVWQVKIATLKAID